MYTKYYVCVCIILLHTTNPQHENSSHVLFGKLVRRENCLCILSSYFYYLSCVIFAVCSAGFGRWLQEVGVVSRNGVCYWQITFPIESWVSRTFVFVCQHMSAMSTCPAPPFRYHPPRRRNENIFLANFPL